MSLSRSRYACIYVCIKSFTPTTGVRQALTQKVPQKPSGVQTLHYEHSTTWPVIKHHSAQNLGKWWIPNHSFLVYTDYYLHHQTMKKGHLRNKRETYKKLAKTLNSRQASHLQTHSCSIPPASCLCPAACSLAVQPQNTSTTSNKLPVAIQKASREFSGTNIPEITQLSLQHSIPQKYQTPETPKYSFL